MKIKFRSLLFTSLLLTVNFSLSAFSFENFLKLDLSPEIGMLNGNISEYVFDPQCQNTDNMLSRLDWEIKTVPYVGITANIDFIRYVHIGLNGQMAFPWKSGSMQDYDWLNSYYWENDDPTELTNYSIHDNYLNEYYTLGIELGGNIPVLHQYLTISPVAAYEYRLISFTGNGGYTEYKSSNFERNELSGDVISYVQETKIFKFGIKLISKPVSFLYAGIDFYWSPFLSSTKALDKHMNYFPGYIYGKAYLDEILNHSLFQFDINVFYTFNQKHRFGLTAGIDYLPTAKGPDFMKALDKYKKPVPKSQWSEQEVSGGTSHFIWNLGLRYSYNF